MKKRIKIAFVGCGNMARAMIESMTNPVSADVLRRNGKLFEITAIDKDEAALRKADGYCSVTRDGASAVRDCAYVVIAVKPQDAEAALSALDLSDKTVISIMAGVSVGVLEELTGAKKIVRVMPNLCARVGESYNAYCAIGIDEEEMETVVEILGSFGVPHIVDERELDGVTGLTGSSPAYIFMTIKALIDEGIAQGFDAGAAKEMAVQAVIGSALTAERESDVEGLIASVCSKGGATAAGVKLLEERGFCDALRAAVRASIERSKELMR